MQSVLGHDVPHEPINWRGRLEAIRRLIEIALASKSKRQSTRDKAFFLICKPRTKTAEF
jgi:hypothetical protein